MSLEPTGEFRKDEWFASTEGLITLGERKEIPTRGDVNRAALADALQTIRAPMVNGRHTGLAAYEAWAEHLLMDEAFATSDLEVLRGRFGAHDGAVGIVAEARWYGALFLSQMATDEPWMAADLLRAAACMAEEHALMWQAWDQVGGIGWGDDKVLKLADAPVRRALSEIVSRSRDACARTADHIEAALRHGADRE